MKSRKTILNSLFFTSRFVRLLLVVIAMFTGSYFMPSLIPFIQIFLVFIVIVAALDVLFLYKVREGISAKRKMAEILSNGDDNTITLELKSLYPFSTNLVIIDELPVQFQYRNFKLNCSLKAAENSILRYTVRPLNRGEYWFGNINVLVRSPLMLAERLIEIPAASMVMVWPSFHSLRSFELLARNATAGSSGTRKVRKLGHSLEFEEIKEYVPGDDLRNVNWKATARKGGSLMVNNFMDERSQQIYCLIDKSRVMKMPFEGMSLLDYAINASLVLSRIALVKYDKAGLICFDDEKGVFVPADRKNTQMSLLAETLYRQQTNFLEADYEKLLSLVKSRISHRSLLVLFTNFESMSSLQRQLPFLRSLAKQHLLLVVFFENTELHELVNKPAENVETVYIKTITEKFIMEKRRMVKELQQYGIKALLTTPAELTPNTINRYLDYKSRQII